MLRKSKAVLEGSGSILQDAYVMLGGITLKELRRIISEGADKAFDELTENMGREISVQQASSSMLDSHLSQWRQTSQ